MANHKFPLGTRVVCNQYVGTITRLCDWSDNLYEVRVPGGVTCTDDVQPLIGFQAVHSTDRDWDWDILEDGHLVTRFNGGWNAVQNVVERLSFRKLHRNDEAQEVADAILRA